MKNFEGRMFVSYELRFAITADDIDTAQKLVH